MEAIPQRNVRLRRCQLDVWVAQRFYWWLCEVPAGGVLVTGDRLQAAPPSPPVGVVLSIFSVLSAALLLPGVRRRLARWLPFEAENPVHTTALMLSCYLVAWSVVSLLWVGGAEGIQDTATDVPVLAVVLQALAFVALAFAGVGLLIRRSWG